MKRGPKPRPLLDRLLANASISGAGECWEWNGATLNSGYGCIRENRKTLLAHRVSYELHIGAIPPRVDICHRCDNRLCINPAHLFIGTRSDNMRDALSKKRMPWQHRTQCKHGHPVAPYERCKVCAADRVKKHRAAKRMESLAA